MDQKNFICRHIVSILYPFLIPRTATESGKCTHSHTILLINFIPIKFVYVRKEFKTSTKYMKLLSNPGKLQVES